MRVFFVYAVVAACSVYALRNWVVSLFALILLTAVHEHEDMPRFLFEIRGLSPWNALFAMTFLAWLLERISTRRALGIPKLMVGLFTAYFVLLTVAVARGAVDVGSFIRWAEPITVSEFVSDYWINAVKYSLPPLLLFDACRTRKRVHWAFICIGLMVTVDALLVIKRIPLATLFGDTDTWVLRRRVGAVTGLHPNDLALMLVIALWSIAGFLPLLKVRWRAAAVGTSVILALALGLCYSRAGFVACAGVGLILGLVGSKRLLLVLLLVIVPLGLASPSVRTRMTQGLHSDASATVDVEGKNDDDALTAGRSKHIWPIALHGIAQSPVIGHGRQASSRVLAKEFMEKYGSVPGHPHNAYFEVLLDMGAIGLIPVLGLFGYLGLASLRLVRTQGDPFKRAVGNAGLAGVAALMIMGLSGQHFFPSENLFAFTCVEAVMFRVYVDSFVRPRLKPPRKRRPTARRAGRSINSALKGRGGRAVSAPIHPHGRRPLTRIDHGC